MSALTQGKLVETTRLIESLAERALSIHSTGDELSEAVLLQWVRGAVSARHHFSPINDIGSFADGRVMRGLGIVPIFAQPIMIQFYFKF